MAGVTDFRAWATYMEPNSMRLSVNFGIPDFESVVVELRKYVPDFGMILYWFSMGEKLMYTRCGFLIQDVVEFLHVFEECQIYLGTLPPYARSPGNPFVPAPVPVPVPVPAPMPPLKHFGATVTVFSKSPMPKFQEYSCGYNKPLDEIPEYAKPNPDICPCGIHYRQCRYHDDRNYAAAKGR